MTKYRMTKYRVLSWLITGVFVSILVSGCSKPPTEAIQAAEVTIKDAQAAGADKYAAERYKAAEAALADAKAKVESKDYKGAKEAADKAIALGDSAKTDAAVGKETAKRDAEKKLAELQVMWKDVNEAVSKVHGKPGDELRKEATDIANMVNTVPQQMQQENYAEALKAIDEATTKGNDLKARAATSGGGAGGKGKKK